MRKVLVRLPAEMRDFLKIKAAQLCANGKKATIESLTASALKKRYGDEYASFVREQRNSDNGNGKRKSAK